MGASADVTLFLEERPRITAAVLPTGSWVLRITDGHTHVSLFLRSIADAGAVVRDIRDGLTSAAQEYGERYEVLLDEFWRMADDREGAENG